MHSYALKVIVLLVISVDNAISNQMNNGTSKTIQTDANGKQAMVIETRRAARRSTSSSSGERAKSNDDDDSGESLGISESTGFSEEVKHPKPKSSAERRGWRKWHRKCYPCPEDMVKKWRDPTINWICGAYQRARRSFKSLCMMHYRNCQDGTMFVKIGDHRCKDDLPNGTLPHGDHFMYDYKVQLSVETSKSDSDFPTSSDEDELSSF